jgi:membrane protease YdiL (CAAX protease family)
MGLAQWPPAIISLWDVPLEAPGGPADKHPFFPLAKTYGPFSRTPLTSMDARQLKHNRRPNLMRKTAALLEVLGIFIAGNFTAGYLGPLLGVKPLGALFQSAFNSTEPDFVTLSIGWFQVVSVQYACLLLPAFAVGWWRRRWGLAHYGVTTGGQSVWFLVGLGLVAFALVALPLKLLWVAKRLIPLGPKPAYWALLEKSWTPSFWLFLAVSSFAFNPVLEELFYRGYCQTRLEEDFGGIGAIVIVALFMTLGHNQYHQLSILSLSTIIGMIPLVVGMGYLFWRSRSLVPAIILHGAVNLPTKGIYDFLTPAVMLTVLVLFRHRWLSMVRNFHQEWIGKGWKRAAIVAIISVIGFEEWPRVFTPIAFAGLAIALFLEFQERQFCTHRCTD